MHRNDEGSISRRGVVGGAALGVAAAAASGPASAQATGGVAKSDPTTKHPKPPFPSQTQPWPGLAGRMEPRPDHGETSYKGSGRLRGRKALITGGDSGMGRAAAIAFAREGADVAISYYPDEEPDAREVMDLIRKEGRIAVALPGDIRDEALCRRIVADAVRQLGGLDILVNNASRQQQRPSLLDITSEDFDATIKTNIYAMFWLTKAALPHLGPGSAIIQTTSEQAYDPSENLVDYAMTKAAMMNFTKSLAKQLGPQGHPRQRRRARADLDAAPGERRGHAGEAAAVRRQHAPRPSRAAGRAGVDLRAARRRGCELRDGPGLWCGRRRRPALMAVYRPAPTVQATAPSA